MPFFIFLKQNKTKKTHFAARALVAQFQKLNTGIHSLLPVHHHIYNLTSQPHSWKSLLSTQIREFSRSWNLNIKCFAQNMDILWVYSYVHMWVYINSNFPQCFPYRCYLSLKNVYYFIAWSHSRGSTDLLPASHLSLSWAEMYVNFPICCKNQLETDYPFILQWIMDGP